MACKILLLEESEAVSKNIFLTLQKSGYEVLSTNSITEGLSILTEYNIKLIIADMNMTEGRIVYFTKELLEDNKFNTIPLLMLADDAGKNSWNVIKGIENWIIKPFSEYKLINTVDRLSI